ncbi:hypothetical protein V8F20_011606 [Naviculisporaceae sp. PSN 640]
MTLYTETSGKHMTGRFNEDNNMATYYNPRCPEKTPEDEETDLEAQPLLSDPSAGQTCPTSPLRGIRKFVLESHKTYRKWCDGIYNLFDIVFSNYPHDSDRHIALPRDEEGRPHLKGHFRDSQSTRPATFADISHSATHLKYHVRSIHFPLEHHYRDRGVHSPWIIKVCLSFHSLIDFTNYDFLWRDNLDKAFWSGIGMAWNSHPTIDGITMFRREFGLEFSADSQQRWAAEVTIWARDTDLVDRIPGGFDMDQMVNKHTCVSMEVLRVDDTVSTAPLCPRQRVFIKYPEPRQGHVTDELVKDSPEGVQQFCVDRNKNLDVDEPELRNILERHIERQLFGDHGQPETTHCSCCSRSKEKEG